VFRTVSLGTGRNHTLSSSINDPCRTPKESREKYGITDGFNKNECGLENVDDIFK
jgi:cystathionine beta-lyase/cystathionine gamma-synthase